MFKNYLKVALRNILRHKVYSFVNVLGLTVGIAVVILILLYVQYEFSFDRHHEKSDQIYRLAKEERRDSGKIHRSILTPPALVPTLKNECPEIISATRLTKTGTLVVSYGEKKFLEKRTYVADPDIFEIFSFPLLKGNPKTALKDPYSIILIICTLTVRNQLDFIQNRDVGFSKDQIIVLPIRDRDVFKKMSAIKTELLQNPNVLNVSASSSLPNDVNFGTMAEWPGKPENVEMEILAILIACLGLFGLVSFTAEQRTKEIGVRKVLGSTVSGIILLLSGKFARYVIAANVIAWPVAYFAMNKWLQDFVYKAPIGIWTFILAGAAAMFIAMLTISYQSIKAATVNPIKALRYE